MQKYFYFKFQQLTKNLKSEIFCYLWEFQNGTQIKNIDSTAFKIINAVR